MPFIILQMRDGLVSWPFAVLICGSCFCPDVSRTSFPAAPATMVYSFLLKMHLLSVSCCGIIYHLQLFGGCANGILCMFVQGWKCVKNVCAC